MQIHHVRGTTLRDALMRARATLGEDALVISHETSQSGVTVSVARAAREPGSAARGVGAAGARKDPVEALRAELAGARRAQNAPSAAVLEVLQRVRSRGASEALIERLRAEIEAGAGSAHAVDLAAAAIARWFPAATSPRVPGATRVLAFAGATGVGKTTSIVKLAARLLRAGRRVELATLDSRRVGAVEQLRAWSRSLEVPLTVLRPRVRIGEKALASGAVDALLVDTTGHPDRDAHELSELEERFARLPVLFDTYVVLSASSNRSALEEVGRALAGVRQSGLVLTKLDETPQPACVLEYVMTTGCPLAFLSDGSDVERNFHRATGDACADLLLRGSLR